MTAQLDPDNFRYIDIINTLDIRSGVIRTQNTKFIQDEVTNINNVNLSKYFIDNKGLTNTKYLND